MYLADIKKGSTQGGRRFVQLSDRYLVEGVLAWCIGDLDGFFVAVSKSTYSYMEMLKRKQRGEEMDTAYAESFVGFQRMLNALIGNDIESARNIASFYGNRSPDKQDSTYHVKTGRAIKYALQGRVPDARNEISGLSEKDVFGNVRKFAKLCTAIILDDQAAAIAALPEALHEFELECRGALRGLPESALFMDGLGLLKFNQIVNGASLELPNDPRLPAELLEQRSPVQVVLEF